MYLNIFQFLLCALLINFSNAFGAANAGFPIYDLALAAHDQKKGCAVVYDACNINYNIRTFKDGDSLLAIAYDRANHTFVGMPLDNSGAVSYIDTSKSPVPLPSGIKTPSEPAQMPKGNFAFDSSNKDKVWHKKPTEFAPNRDYNWQSAKEVVFIGREVGSNFDKNWVATYIGGVTFVSELNTSLQHAILLSGYVKKPVIGVETTPNTTGTTFLERLRSPASTPNAGFLVQLPVPVIIGEQKQSTSKNSQQQTVASSAKLATAKISNSNANDGNDDEQQVPSCQTLSKKKPDTKPNNSKPVYLSDKDQKEVGRLYNEAFQNITASASRAFATFGKPTQAVQEILYDIYKAQSTASTLAEFKKYVADAKENLKKLVDQHHQAQLQEAQAKRDALIAAMQPVIADETAAREKLAATLQQEITDSLADIFEQAMQEKVKVKQSPAHQKYVEECLYQLFVDEATGRTTVEKEEEKKYSKNYGLLTSLYNNGDFKSIMQQSTARILSGGAQAALTSNPAINISTQFMWLVIDGTRYNVPVPAGCDQTHVSAAMQIATTQLSSVIKDFKKTDEKLNFILSCISQYAPMIANGTIGPDTKFKMLVQRK